MTILGLASVLFLFISLFYVEIKWGPDYNKTFSRLVALKRPSIIFYFVIIVIFLSVFSLFITTSLVSELKHPELFLWVFFIGVISQLVCVTVPETGGYKTKVHLIAASVMSVSALLQVFLLFFYAQLQSLSTVICSLSLIVMLTIWFIILSKHRLIKNELALQILYFVCYLGTLLFVVYIK